MSSGGSAVPVRFLVAGTGAVVEKLRPTWDLFESLDVELHAADIRDDATGRRALPSGTTFYNWKHPDQLRSLVQKARERQFDFAYVSTFPSLHIFTALRLDFIANQFIFPKPVDSNYGSMTVIHNEDQMDRALTLARRSYVHDHYRNKPLTHYLRAHMANLHSRNGFIKTIRTFITEHKSIQVEFNRRESLECGMILDLCPHALSVVYEILPASLTWKDEEGNIFKRVSRRFEVVSCFRGRDNLSILHNSNSETFGAIHLRGFENIHFIPRNTDKVAEVLNDRAFDILFVIGKGITVGDRKQDLKAIELEFDGQTVRGNFDTAAIGGVVDSELQRTIETTIEPRHRGLNLPLMHLAKNQFDLERATAGQLITPFQCYQEAYEIASLLEGCREHSTARDLLHYRPGSAIADVVNRCQGRGLDRKWALDEDDVARLVFGDLPLNAIP